MRHSYTHPAQPHYIRIQVACIWCGVKVFRYPNGMIGKAPRRCLTRDARLNEQNRLGEWLNARVSFMTAEKSKV